MANNEISLGLSPNADDAFMFYALARGKVSSGRYEIKPILRDLQTLNEWAMRRELDITALSIHAYPYVKSYYYLLTCGAGMGLAYGPIVVTREPMSLEELAEKNIAVPGTMTTAFLLLRLMLGDFNYECVPADKILDKVADGEVEAGLITHKGQLRYPGMGLHKVIDLGIWWHRETGLPLPLSGTVIKRSLPANTIDDLQKILCESIRYGMDHFDDALDYAMEFAGTMSREQVGDFVNMYINHWTLDCGQDGKKAIVELLGRAETRHLIPSTLPVEFV
jgi:1,4-dihydroxy-6-naphthoate synthase